MKTLWISCLSIAVLSCSGKKAEDARDFGSMTVAARNLDADANADAKVEASDSVIIAEGVNSSDVDGMAQQDPTAEAETGKAADPSEKGEPVTDTKGKEPPAPGKGLPPADKTPAPKYPELPPELKVKLAKCYAQWEKIIWDKDTLIDIRQVSVDVDKLKSSNIQLAGSKAEVVFVDITAASKISKVNLSLENAKALYCVDIKAEKVIDRLDIDYVCGAKVGVLQIEAAKAKRVNVREICPIP